MVEGQDDDALCIICAESLNASCIVERTCCRQQVCQSCFYHHISSILEEAHTGGRRRLLCPLGCAQEVTDTEVRQCFHRQHFSLLWEVTGLFLYLILCGWWVPSSGGPSTTGCRHYRYWWFFLHSAAERRDLQRYEAWSQVTAFAEMTKKRGEIVQHCPAPDCGFAWVVPDPDHQRSKQAQERRRVFFMYSAPRFETTPLNWVQADFLNINVTGSIARDIDDAWYHRDGRRMACGKCNFVFCGLCRHPWTFGRRRHSGVSCSRYARMLPSGWEPQDHFGWRNTRACPGCQMRTHRISGCNHMTCPCGYEWCYVCGTAWDPRHYRCLDSRGRTTADACTIL